MLRIIRFNIAFILFGTAIMANAQNALFIPPTLSGTNFQLTIQPGTKTFFAGYSTPTYGINGALLAPTLILNQGDEVTLNVTNTLNTFTTIHWHGLHVPAEDDGGPHQVIQPNASWSPRFKVMNDAGTYWYHPHGAERTDLHVSKGIAGLIIIKDSIEAKLTLPRTYGVDDIPLVIQTKAFDELKQIAISTEMDTVLMVNGTLNPFVNAPAQVVRFRLLNGSSSRSYQFGFSNNMLFHMIASDGGLLQQPYQTTRLRLSPGERAEILVDLSSMQGQNMYLKNYASELPNGIHGAKKINNGMVTLPDYENNFLNGTDTNVLQINVTAPTVNPVTTIPAQLVNFNKPDSNVVDAKRDIVFAPKEMGMLDMIEGPFTINGKVFNMDSINIRTKLNNVEVWRLVNQTGVAHPFHIHDIQFYVLSVNGNPPTPDQAGKKDVVLIQPNQSVSIITKFEDFAHASIPYMYHCHVLHHEDDGMMGQFLVMPETGTGIYEMDADNFSIYPNPASGFITITGSTDKIHIDLFTVTGVKALTDYESGNQKQVDISTFAPGIYFLKISTDNQITIKKIIIK
ncbi:MAG: multicopper oxidase domain-containing protein [Bacteroidetes bacterium]|nr:MAG: multicopper oxidase domain-containing protein [Bacteroidota bacterium]